MNTVLKIHLSLCPWLISKDHNSFISSFDIDSLFTKVILEEKTEIVIKNVFDRNRKINGFSKSDFLDLLKLTAMAYKELGVRAMGSFLEPELANAFLWNHEGKRLM